MELNSDFKNKITQLIETANYSNQKEIEIRIGKFKENGHFNPGVNLCFFEECIRFLNTFAKFEGIEYSNIEYYNGLKKYYILDTPTECNTFSFKDTNTKNIFYIKKVNIETIDIKDYNFRISYNDEYKYEKSIEIDNTTPNFFVIRKRFTYSFENYKFDVSMYIKDTIEIKSSNWNNYDFVYDFEMEVKRNPEKIDKMFELITQFLCVNQTTRFLLSETQKNKINDIYFNLTRTRKFIGSQPQTISNEKIDGKLDNYAMTLKLDGKRKLLMNIGNEIYEISSKMEFKYTGIKTNLNLNDITLLDCELFQGTYYVFDILYFEGSDLRKQIFNMRMKFLDKFLHEINGNRFIQKKHYIENNINANSIKYYKKYFSGNCIGKLDGFIYVPKSKDYLNGIQLKYKPKNENTIDFKIKKIGNLTIELYCNDKNGNDILFNFPNYNEKISKTVLPLELYNNYPNNTVVEFYFSLENETFIPKNQRPDKLKGNFIDVAIDNFKSILNPYEFNTNISKPPLFNARRFNNFIKRKLLMENTKSAYTLLDLACGKGGDMHKWVDCNISYVKGYDLDIDSINEAKNRYNKSIKDENTSKNYHYSFELCDLSKQIIDCKLIEFVNCVSENRWENDKFDISTCFFAIHYFFKDADSLDILITNISQNLKIGGTFIMSTFDNESLESLNYNIDTELFKVKKTNKQIDNSKSFGNEISVWIKDSVLNVETIEYIVNFEFLVKKLKEHGIELISSGKFDEFYDEWKTKKNILNETEKMLCFINRYAIFKKTSSKIKVKEPNVESVNPNVQSVNPNVESVNPTVERETPNIKVFNFHDFTEIEQEIEQEIEEEIEQEIKFIEKDIKNKKLVELKEICRELGISTTGKKELLIKRILDNNQN